jgi:DNA-binding transcriptional MerR regulator
MFRIGDFSRIARVSARLLLLRRARPVTPAHADPHSGYRFLHDRQLAQLNRITVLKELGFSLEQIGDILKTPPAASDLRNMLLLRRKDRDERAMAREPFRVLHLIERLTSGGAGRALVTSAAHSIATHGTRHRLLSLRRTVASFAEARALIGVLREESRPLLPKRHDCPLVVIAHAPQFEADELDAEFGYCVEALSPAAPPKSSLLQLRELAAVPRMAVCVRVGLPEDAHLVTAKVGRFLAANGDTLRRALREAFLRPPDPQRMHESVVEMQFPVRRLDAQG